MWREPREKIFRTVHRMSSLFINFVKFEKAFDSLDRNILRKLLWHYGIPIKLVNIIKCTYDGFTSQVISHGMLSDTEIKTGLRQGCLLSPLLFLIAVDWKMRMSVDGQRTGLQWNPFKQLDDLDFADDLALISGTHTQIQRKTTRLHDHSKQIASGLTLGRPRSWGLTPKPTNLSWSRTNPLKMWSSSYTWEAQMEELIKMLSCASAKQDMPLEHSDLYGPLPSSPETPKSESLIQM